MDRSLSITRRLFANIIDNFLSLACAVLFIFIFASVFGLGVVDAGAYIGAINLKHSDILNNPYMDHEAIANGEMWTLIIFSLAISLTQLLGECVFSATLGIRLLGGICVDEKNNKITTEKALYKCVARLLCLPIIYCIFTHAFNMTPLMAIVSVYIISFIMLLNKHVNLVEKLTQTKTIRRVKDEEK